MRIALAVSSYHPLVGGVETHVGRIAEGCVAAGDDVTVLTHQLGDDRGEKAAGPVRVLRFPVTVRPANYSLSLPMFRYLREHDTEFDLVHAHSYHTLAGQAAVRSCLPVVFTPHYHGTGHTPFRAFLHQVYRPFGARLFAAADAVICVSQAERELVVRDFPRVAGKVAVIPNGTDARSWPPRPRGTADDAPLVLVVGRLERYKNVDLVIRAFRAKPVPADLVIAGDGPDRSRLERIARGQPGRPVRFSGQVPDQELGELLARATVVISASDHEAFGLTLADGLAAGARVVASAIPAHRELGRLAGASAPIAFVDPADTRQFAAALAAALEAGRVPPGTTRLPTWADVVHQTRAVYARVVAGGCPAGSRAAT